MLQALRRNGISTLKYLGTTEVHTYAFSVAANAILSFFPAAVLLLTICRRLFHSPSMVGAIKRMLAAYLPSNQAYITATVDSMSATHKIQMVSIVMLFISCTGVFEPLEVALNSVWGFKSRNYLMNQIVSLGLALACGILALLSVAGAAGVWAPAAQAQSWLGHHIGTGIVYSLVDKINLTVQFFALKAFGMIASVLIFFLIYWLLPNGKVPYRAVLPAAIITGVAWEIAKLIFVACLPLLDFHEAYGPFYVSVTLIFWAFFSGLLLLGGAHLSAQDLKTSQKQSPMTPEPAEAINETVV
ncbi:MAG: YihY/virulence factor BrkB family protein [Acidobacteria bacterium]|nr:MAG: YihY/virulence factor BrkB family protein [Acidobacteriota bacterium]